MNRRPEGERDDDLRDVFDNIEREIGRRRAEDAMYSPPQSPPIGLRRGPMNVRPGMPPPPPRSYDQILRLPTSTPRLVYALLVINIFMYGVTLALALNFSEEGFYKALFILGAKDGPAIDAGQYWRFLTPIFLHGGLIHLAFNSYALYALGRDAERLFGTMRFGAIYLLAGLAGSIASYVRSPTLSIGASGAIFGLIGALAAYFYSVRSLIGAETSRVQVTQLISMAAINLVLGFSIPNLDNAAHIGGLVAGAVTGFALAPRYRVDTQSYIPTVLRIDRPALGWLMVGAVLLALVAWAAYAVMQ